MALASAAAVFPLPNSRWLLRMDEVETRPGSWSRPATIATATSGMRKASRSGRVAGLDSAPMPMAAAVNAITPTAVDSHIQSTPAANRNTPNAAIEAGHDADVALGHPPPAL